MFDAIEKIRPELVIAQAQLESAKKSKTSASILSNGDLFALMQIIEYRRGQVDMASRLISLLAKDMRREAANDLWKRKNT